MCNQTDNQTINEPCQANTEIAWNDEPRVYVACLAAYNSGYLHGKWIDATQEPEDIYKEIYAMLAKSPIPDAEEWEIHDRENFGALVIERYDSVESAHEKAVFFEEHGELGAALAEYYGGDIDDAKNALANYYHGEYDSDVDFASQCLDEICDIPSHIRFYIDEELFCRDIFINDYFSIDADGKVHVFSYA